MAVAALLSGGKAAAGAAAVTDAGAATAAAGETGLLAGAGAAIAGLIPVLEIAFLAVFAVTAAVSVIDGLYAVLRHHNLSAIAMVTAESVTELPHAPQVDGSSPTSGASTAFPATGGSSESARIAGSSSTTEHPLPTHANSSADDPYGDLTRSPR